MYGRQIQDRTLTFGVSGALIMNALVMYDRETDTLWSQFLGVGVQGELVDTPLEYLGSSLTTWSAWRQAHPDTLVLDQGRRRSDPYDGYYSGNSAGVRGQTNEDARLATKEFVLGLQLPNGATKAYPFRALSRTPIVNDEVGGTAVVVTFDSGNGSTAAFSRLAGDRLLTFAPAEGGRSTMTDAETGSTWSRLTGTALEGPLAGAVLEPVPSFAVFWFAWSDFHPASAFYEP